MQGMDMPGMDMDHAATQPAATRPATTSMPAGYSEIRIPREIQQRIGVTVGEVRRAPLVMTVQPVGILRPNETKIARIHIKTEGWVEKLFVSFTGQKVKRGDALLSIYSPQFLIAQQEYLISLPTVKAGQDNTGAKSLLDAARQKLELLDVPPEEIKELESRGAPKKTLILRALISGTVLEKKAFEGQYVKPEDELFSVADLSTIWVQAKVYEYELPHVQIGQGARVTLPALPMQEFTGNVVFISPTVEEPARTVQVRIELPNPTGLLKPGMFCQVTLTHQMGEGLLAPAESIIRMGEKDIAFRVTDSDRFIPMEVKISPLRFGDSFHVMTGLNAGDRVSTSANFLIDSESRLQAGGGAMAAMAGMPGMEMGGSKSQGSSQDENMPGMDMGGHSGMRH